MWNSRNFGYISGPIKYMLILTKHREGIQQLNKYEIRVHLYLHYHQTLTENAS